MSVVDKIEQDIFGVTQDRISDAAKPMREPTVQAMGIIHKMLDKKGELTGVPSR